MGWDLSGKKRCDMQAPASWAAHACVPGILHREHHYIFRRQLCLVPCRRIPMRPVPLLSVSAESEKREMGAGASHCRGLRHSGRVHCFALVFL